MRRATVSTLAVALVLAMTLQGAVAMRLPSPNSLFGDNFETLLGRGRVRADTGDDLDRRKEMKNPAYVAMKFIVPPTVHDKFIDEWKNLEDHAMDEKHNIIYELGKTTTDNLHFYLYGEWETGRDALDHFESKAFQDFKDFAMDNDIQWEFYGLESISNPKDERRNLDRKGKMTDMPAHVLIKYHVPPSHFDEFEDAWLDMAQDTWDEKANMVFSLRKVKTSNSDYVACGTWESFNAWHDHFHSKHFRSFKENVGDIGVTWFISPLEKFSKKME